MSNEHDAVIIGAGPAGLATACALADRGFAVALVEPQPRAVLATPPADGREIALTHRAIGILRALGIWQRIAATQISPVAAACVLDGRSPRALRFDPRGDGVDTLGSLVANALIRKAAFEAASARSAIQLIDARRCERLHIDSSSASVTLDDGQTLRARVLIAADGRHSQARQKLGIGARTQDFGRTAIVCRLRHDAPPDGIAYECFGHGRTLAILPLREQQVSAVITVASDQADALLRLSAEAFAASITEQFGTRLGALHLAGERHAYPLVAVFADRFAAPRAALIGDAAVGMHPVTAHGYNLGLYGAETLARVLAAAGAHGDDIGAFTVLDRYARAHRRHCRPLYFGTNALVALYTDERAPARALRHTVLCAADHFPH